MTSKTDWRIQWHITGDGTVIKQRSKGDEVHQQLFGRYPTRRTVEMSDLEVMEDRLARFSAFWARMSAILLYAFWALTATLLAGIVCLLLGLDAPVWAPLIFISVPLLLVIGLSVGLMARRLRSRPEGIRTEAGFESGEWETMAATEARAMIDAPGTVSGQVFRAERA